MRKTRERARRRITILGLLAALTTVVAMALVPTASAHHLSASVQLTLPTVDALTNKTDLYPLLPTVSASYEGTVPAVFLDTDEIDGHSLYRFDAVIANYDATLDIICQNCTLPTRTISQVLWPLGRPPAGDLPSAIALPNTSS